MTEPDPLTVAQRFGLIVGNVLRVVALLGGRDHAKVPLVVLAWTRVNNLRRRFAALLVKWEAGTLRAPRPRTAAARRARAATRRPEPARIPGKAGWLGQFVPETRGYYGQLRHLLEDAEMLALIAAAPQAGRVLRPLCRILSVPLPEALRLPPRPKRTSVKTARAGGRKAKAPPRRPSSLAGPNPGVVRIGRRYRKGRGRSP